MSSQVLSGASNPSYTNNTGQNVRIVINFMRNVTAINWAGVSATASSCTIGRNLAYTQSVTEGTTVDSTIVTSKSAFIYSAGFGPNDIVNTIKIPSSTVVSSGNNMGGNNSLPTELMLASGQTFSAICSAYNIVVIPEAG
jgi:hypothetical protein